MRKWDPDKIVAALRDRRSRGLALNTGAIQKSDPPLARAIFNHFRFHDAALLAAGIDPASVRKWSFWDKARNVAALRVRRDAGMTLGFAAIYRDDTPLGAAIARYFGSNGAALRAAGMDPETVGARGHRWDKADIEESAALLRGKGAFRILRQCRSRGGDRLLANVAGTACERARRGRGGRRWPMKDTPAPSSPADPLPLPMLNEYAYRPRPFHFTHVEGRWPDNQHALEAKL